MDGLITTTTLVLGSFGYFNCILKNCSDGDLCATIGCSGERDGFNYPRCDVIYVLSRGGDT